MDDPEKLEDQWHAMKTREHERSCAAHCSSLRVLTKTVEVPDHEATGRQMREARVAVGLSLREVSRRMKLSASFVSDLERGRRNWNDYMVASFEAAISSTNAKDMP